ncbi:MAG: hypothetical protein ABFR36_06565 [Acidobacteriota bacterium]
MKKIILTLILIIIFTVFSTADIYVKRVKDTEAYEMMGKKKPGRTEIEEVWMSKDKYVSDTKTMKIIIDYKNKNIKFLIVPKKMYFEIPMNFTPETIGKYFPPKIVEILRSIGLKNVRTEVDNKKVRIGNWDCFKLTMEMDIVIPALNMIPKMKIVTWMTKKAPFNYLEYRKGMNDFFEGFFTEFIKLDEKTSAEFKKLDGVNGFEVGADAEFTFFGSTIKSTMRAIDVKKRKAPPGIYSIPAGYKKMDIFAALGAARNLP